MSRIDHYEIRYLSSLDNTYKYYHRTKTLKGALNYRDRVYRKFYDMGCTGMNTLRIFAYDVDGYIFKEYE